MSNTTAPKFKVGDTVKVLENLNLHNSLSVGTYTTITSITKIQGVYYFSLIDGYSYEAHQIELESATAPSPTPYGMPPWEPYTPTYVGLDIGTEIHNKMLHNCTYKSYLGLTEKYDFCTVCDAKKYN